MSPSFPCLTPAPPYDLFRFRRDHPDQAAALGYRDPAHLEPHWFVPSVRAQQKLARLQTAVAKARDALAAAEAAETAYRETLYAQDFARTVVRPAQRSGRARFALLAATEWGPALAAISTPNHWADNDCAPWPAFLHAEDVIVTAACPDPITYHLTVEVLWSRKLNHGGQWDGATQSRDYQEAQAAVYADWDRAAPRWITAFRTAWEHPSRADVFTIAPFHYPSDKGVDYGFTVEWTWRQAHRSAVQAVISAWVTHLTQFARAGRWP